jgi:stage II sporulation protein R
MEKRMWVLWIPLLRRFLSRFAGALTLSLLAGLWLLHSWMVPFSIQPASSPLASFTIPDEAIRFRVLANSNTVADQWVKRRVRDAVLAQIERWVGDAADVHAVRQVLGNRVDELQALADRVLMENGFPYRSRVDYGEVPFPKKTFGGRTVPAGQYEALRIILGEGQGDNWWCVLFPPLCFAGPDNPDKGEEEARETKADSAPLHAEIRFFLWDWLRGWFEKES